MDNTMVCDEKGPNGIFDLFNEDGVSVMKISRSQLEMFMPDLPTDQMTVEVDFAY